MEINQLKARLALLDTMLNKMNSSSELRMTHLKRTVFVLRAMLNEGGIPSAYGPQSAIAQFSLQ